MRSFSTLLSPHFLVLALCLLCSIPSTHAFDTSDFDSYGAKIAGNDYLSAEIINQDNSQGYLNFFLNTSVYPLSTPQYYCASYLDETWITDRGAWSMFGYGVAMGSRDSVNQSVIWWGEMNGGNWNDQTADPIQMTVGGFSGMVVIPPDYRCGVTTYTQDTSGTPATLTVAIGHQEFFQMAVQPEGNYAIGIANTFGFTMDLTNMSATGLFTPVTMSTALYFTPLDQTFTPRVVALETSWGVTAGWVQNIATKQWFAVLLLFAHNATNFNLTDRYQYSPAASSWQASVQVGDASAWKPQHDLSLAVRQDGTVLFGLQLYNTVLLFTVKGARLHYQGSKSMGAKAVGFGKSVSWTGSGAAQLLYNVYTSDYSAVSSPSTIEVYNVPVASALNSTSWNDSYPLVQWVYPNPTQSLSTALTTSTFVTAISTPSTLFILDTVGSTLFIQPAPPGYYQPTVSGYDAQQPCPAGSYNNMTSYEACQLCPPGTYRAATMPARTCAACSAGAYCPLGAVGQVTPSMLEGVAQTFVYPTSPESTILDDIMFQNVFFLHGPTHCVGVSPVFWALIVLGFLLLILGCMFRLRYCVNDAKSRKIRRLTKFVFKRADLVKEGEHWIGGLMSLVLMVFIVMGIWFTSSFVLQYPIESAPNPNFACQPTYNAKFSSSIQSIALPADEVAEPMYDMLSEQALTLQLDVLNTNISCDEATATVVTSVSTTLPFTCTSLAAATLTLQAPLPAHTTTVQFSLKGQQLIGGLRLGIQGAADTSDEGSGYTLRQVDASQSLTMSAQTLQKDVTLPISLTKVINSTAPLSTSDIMTVSGLWIPVFPTADDSMFMSSQTYLSSPSSPFTLTISITESPFWVYNEQEPIARSAEAAFKTLLYIIMLLEIFGLAFLIVKLVQPLIHCVGLRWKGRSVKKVWDRPDSSDEENWIEDVMYGDQVKRMASRKGSGGSKNQSGVRELSEGLRNERAKARQERREAMDGKTLREEGSWSAKGSAKVHVEEGMGSGRAHTEVQLTSPLEERASLGVLGGGQGERMEPTEVV